MKTPIKDPPEVARVRKLLQQWDDGIITRGEFEILAVRETFEESVLKDISAHDHSYSFIMGCFHGPLKHNYGLYDICSQSQGFYNFSLKNIIRFYWNKLCRRLGWHRTWIL